MNDPLKPTLCAEKLAALAAPERLRIVRFLCDGEKNVTEIAEMLDTPPVNVAHHMTVLRHAGIVFNRKQGRYVYYALTPGFLQAAGGKEYLDLGCCRLEVPCQPVEEIRNPKSEIRRKSEAEQIQKPSDES